MEEREEQETAVEEEEEAAQEKEREAQAGAQTKAEVSRKVAGCFWGSGRATGPTHPCCPATPRTTWC